MQERLQKTLTLKIIFGLLAANLVIGGFIVSWPARAQWVTTNPDLMGVLAPSTIKKDYIAPSFTTAAMMALVNAGNYFMQKLAYDTATYIGSGGKGQKPMLFTKNWGDYLGDTFKGAAGEFLGSLSQTWGKGIGFNLCQPPTASLKISLMLGMTQSVKPPKPKCDWAQIQGNWGRFLNNATNVDALTAVSASFSPGSSGLGLALKTNTKLDAYVAQKTAEAQKSREGSGGFKDVTSVISGKVQTPASVMEQKSKELTGMPMASQQAGDSSFKEALAAGAWQILPSALSTFTNVLLSNFSKRLFEGLFKTEDASQADPFDYGAEAGTDKAAVQAQFAYLLTPAIQDAGAYDAVTEFTVCPDQFKSTNNCVLDTPFATAVNQAKTGAPLTVADAIAQGFLNKDLPLISPNDPQNGDPYCFRKGYCYSNLVKLRRYRIIPVGWEFAAMKNDPKNPKSLGFIVGEFNNCNDSTGEADAEHPWCHLIDPNWVLKYPSTECRAKVSGETLLSSDTPIRVDTCVDAPSCISENDQGKCIGGWGYCTKEKNIWRIGGDACPSYYNTCSTLTRTVDGTVQNLLKNTVDYSTCSADNAGCRWYSRQKNLATNTWLNTSAVYLNRKAEKCDASDAGCSVFIKKDQGVRENLVTNPSFEDGDVLPNYWGPDNKITEYDTVGTNSLHGTRAIRVTSGVANFVESKLPIRFESDAVYNLSVYAKKSGGEPEGQVALLFNNIQVSDWAVLGSCTRAGNSLILKFNPAETYGRADCSFVTSESLNSDINTAVISLGAAGTGDVWYDAVMLSEWPFTQEFIPSGYGDEVPRVYLKAPPAWLGCTGAETDNPACKLYARVCSKAEAGCELWAPKNGDPAIPAVTTANDSCPRECIGYETWRQEPTAFTGVQFPLYFIPTTGLTCSANEAGCDEFTNIETAAQGGETREYFVDFRRCMKPNPAEEATYYTWEGSDATGYQLKSFVLKIGNIIANRTPQEVGRPPAYQANTDPSLCTKDIFNARTNPDCREMYDADGNISYRLYLRTILSTADCREYRKTESTETDCNNSDGAWNVGSSSCTYLAYKPESTTCKAAAKGCRAYVGNTGRNVREVFADNMEKPPNAQVWTGTEFSTESTVAGGHSYKISGGNATFVNALAPGATYTLNIWAKGTGTLGVDVGAARDSNTPLPPAVTLTVNWKLYSFGPIRIDSGHVLAASDKVTLLSSGTAFIDNISLKQVNQNIYLIKDSWKTPVSCDQTSQGAYLPQAMLGCKDYTNRAGNSFALKSFSKICRADNVGCSALIDTKNSSEIQAKTWGAVCRGTADSDCSYDGKVVCHIAPGRDFCNFDILGAVPPAYQNTASSTVVIPTDSVVYLVNNDANSCQADKTGCEAVGNPEINTTKTVAIAVEFDEDDCDDRDGEISADGKTCTAPTTINFSVTDCRNQGWTVSADNLTCIHQIVSQFTPGDCTARGGIVSPDGGTCTYNTGDKIGNFVTSDYKNDNIRNNPDDYQNILCNADTVGCEEYKAGSELLYFKDPNERVCEYRESVKYLGESVNGWFKKGTDEPCDPAKKVGVAFYDIWHNGDLQYKNWVGQCTADANMCTEFVDPVDTQNQSGKPQAYYYIDNEKIDRATCKGQVSPKEGCVLLDQTSIVAKNYSAATTYLASDSNGNQLVAPADATNTKVCMRQRIGSICLFSYCPKVEVTPLTTCETNVDCLPPDPCAGKTGLARTLCLTSVARYSYSCEPVVNDTNVILKVRRDRECAEWLDCRNSNKVYDSLNNSYKNVCTSLDVCNSYIKQNEAVRCNNFVESDVRDDKGNPAVLTDEIYSSRDVRWGGREYSGYSLPNKYSVSDLKTISFGKNVDGSEDLRLSYAVKPSDVCFSTTYASLGFGSLAECNASYACPVGDFSSPCGAVNNLGRRGTCMGGSCVYGVDGQIRTPAVSYGAKAYDKVVPVTCRAYPEKDSPFPSSVATWTDESGKLAIQGGNYGASSAAQFLASKNSAFAGANVCENWLDRNSNGTVEPGELQNCECAYRKAEYQNKAAIKYFGLNGPPIPSGICTGGLKDGRPCDPLEKESCGTADAGGTCQPLTRVDRLQGWDGQCLEKDFSTPINGGTDFACLTWRPVGVVPGGRDIYNQYSQAGYNQPTATTGKYYCALVKGNMQTIDKKFTYSLAATVDKEDIFSYTDVGIPENMGFLTNTGGNGYGEALFSYNQSDPFKSLPSLNKNQIFAIEIVPIDEQYNGESPAVALPTIKDGTGATNQQQAEMAKEWFAIKGNILSREHGGVVPAGQAFAGYSYWEARWNIEWDAPAGKVSSRGSKPMFMFDMKTPQDKNNFVSGSCNDGGKPYFAVRALFAPNGQLSKFWTSYCNSTIVDRMIKTKINILLGEPCTNIIQVVSESGENSALTDNLWQGTISNFGSDWAGDPFGKNQRNPLYGSANASFTPDGSRAPWFESASGLGSANVSTKYAPFIDAGTHWGCGNLDGCASSTLYHDLSQFLDTDESPLGSKLNGVTYGYPPAPNISTMLSGPNNFWRLFSKAYDIFELTYGNGYDTYSPGAGGGYDLRLIDRPTNGTRLSLYYLDYINKPPRIASPDGACADPKAGCDIVSLDTFSVNDQNSAENMLGDGSYFVRLKFYGWADTNHMPLISRTVDWNGDGKDVDRTVSSKYKNHKPYCGSNVGECAESSRGAIGLTCDVAKNLANGENTECQNAASNISKQCTATDPARFGNSADACVQDYFEFTHTYVCSNKILNGLNNCSGSNYPCKNTITDPNMPNRQVQVCVYRPRVQVVDNWHQCNGNCGTDANGNRKICFGLGTDEDDGRADCTVSGAGWTNYGGIIQVTPQ